jgi:hypothetical protein
MRGPRAAFVADKIGFYTPGLRTGLVVAESPDPSAGYEALEWNLRMRGPRAAFIADHHGFHARNLWS